MKQWFAFGVILVGVVNFAVGALDSKAPVAASSVTGGVSIVRAGYWGTAEDDDMQGAAVAADGTVYVVGMAGVPMKNLPVGVKPTVFGKAPVNPLCGAGYVAHLSADMTKVLHYAEFAPGVTFLTSVSVAPDGVYVGGYASDALAPLIDGKGLITGYPLTNEVRLIAGNAIAAANGLDKDPLAGRPGLGRQGAPCVLLLSSDLGTVRNGTYLEGWQQVWNKDRVRQMKPDRKMWPTEWFWQPTLMTVCKDGGLIVCHDGGYFKTLTDKDRELAKGDAELLKRLGFYDVPDYVSRLSSDLMKRTWTTAFYTPPTDPEVAKQVKVGWPYPYYSNPRTHRMRMDRDGNIWVAGYSAAATAQEPWWVPYVWRISAADGITLSKLYEHDPMGGSDHRVNGTVADTGVTALTLDEDGNILAGLIADGGNTVMGWSPTGELNKRFEGTIKGDTGVKLVHWWSHLHRTNSKTGEGIMGVRLHAAGGGPAWNVDLASLPQNYILSVGRFNRDLTWTPDAWQGSGADENPLAFLQVYSPDFNVLFSTALRGIVPYEMIKVSDRRYLVVGQAMLPEAPVKDSLGDKPVGKNDGYYLLLEFSKDFPAFVKK